VSLWWLEPDRLGTVVFGMMAKLGAPGCSPPGPAGPSGKMAWGGVLYRCDVTGGEGKGERHSLPHQIRFDIARRALSRDARIAARPDDIGLYLMMTWGL
jgi:hypothetical protein